MTFQTGVLMSSNFCRPQIIENIQGPAVASSYKSKDMVITIWRTEISEVQSVLKFSKTPNNLLLFFSATCNF